FVVYWPRRRAHLSRWCDDDIVPPKTSRAQQAVRVAGGSGTLAGVLRAEHAADLHQSVTVALRKDHQRAAALRGAGRWCKAASAGEMISNAPPWLCRPGGALV